MSTSVKRDDSNETKQLRRKDKRIANHHQEGEGDALIDARHYDLGL